MINWHFWMFYRVIISIVLIYVPVGQFCWTELALTRNIPPTTPHPTKLKCYPTAGTNLAGTGEERGVQCDIAGLVSRVSNPLQFLGLYKTHHEASRRTNIPAIACSGRHYYQLSKYEIESCLQFICQTSNWFIVQYSYPSSDILLAKTFSYIFLVFDWYFLTPKGTAAKPRSCWQGRGTWRGPPYWRTFLMISSMCFVTRLVRTLKKPLTSCY